MTMDLRPVRRALLSVSDKTGLADLAHALARKGVALISTGSTAATLRATGLTVTEVAEVTGSPEMLGGRVKTLHPRIHGGLLARRDDPTHLAEMAAQGIEGIDLLVVNLYPFEATRDSGAPFDEIVEQIDVGGPAMIRAAAKNHRDVAVVTDPADYAALLAELEQQGGTTGALRRALAQKAFGRTAAYDAAIAAWLSGDAMDAPWRALAGRLGQPLRYGENPHQRAALYLTQERRSGVATARLVQGKPLSYNNIADADAAWEALAELRDTAACVIVKHANPCGAAVGETVAEAHAKALACDPVSAFGGIVAVSRPLDRATAEAVTAVFTEVVVAPDADAEAREVFARKPNLRLLLAGDPPDPAAPGLTWKAVAGGFLLQDRDKGILERNNLQVVTSRAPDEAEMADLIFAWKVVKHVKSNAIVLASGGATVGIGAGQMSRVDSVRIATWKMAERAGERTGRVVMASDAFFPFPDGVEAAARAGVTAVIQPGGSQRDAEVIAAAESHGMAMVLTGLRHFRH